MNMIQDVAAFMQAGEQQNTPGQVSKQLGYVLEEAAEVMAAIGDEDAAAHIDNFGHFYKRSDVHGVHAIESADRLELLDGLLDLAWVAIGGAIAMGADVEGAWAEIVRSNMSKVDPATGKMLKDASGKIIKPPHFSKPDLGRFLP